MNNDLRIPDNTEFTDEWMPAVDGVDPPADKDLEDRRADYMRRVHGEDNILTLGPPPEREHRAKAIREEITEAIHDSLAAWVRQGDDVLEWAKVWSALPPGSMDQLTTEVQVVKVLAGRIIDGRGPGGDR